HRPPTMPHLLAAQIWPDDFRTRQRERLNIDVLNNEAKPLAPAGRAIRLRERERQHRTSAHAFGDDYLAAGQLLGDLAVVVSCPEMEHREQKESQRRIQSLDSNGSRPYPGHADLNQLQLVRPESPQP